MVSREELPGGLDGPPNCYAPAAAHLHLPFGLAGHYTGGMRIAKPLLLVSTPVGAVGGLVEAYRLAGGLVLVMLAGMGVLAAAMGSVISTIRREKRAMSPPTRQEP